jgi:putative transcriptional regulator
VERGFILHSTDERFEASLDLGCGIMLSSAREVLEAIADDDGPEQFLVALGYAGWDAGQLESEVADNAWLTAPVAAEEARRIIFETRYDERIARAADSLGIDFSLISSQAGHA